MKTNSKRAIAVAVFNLNLKTLPKVGSKVFRKNVLDRIEADTDCTRACAAAMYNYAKKLAVQAGKVDEFGRAAKVAAVAPVEVAEVAPVAECNDAWAVVDADYNVVGTYASRAKARAAKAEGQRVVSL